MLPSGVELQLEQVRKLKGSEKGHRYASLLAAIEDTIETRAVPRECAAYIAILLPLLDVNESRSAAVYLLGLILPHAGRMLVVSKTPILAEKIAPILADTEAETSLVRSAIGCIQALVEHQHVSAWATPANELGPVRLLLGIYTLTRDPRPKIRRKAVESIEQLMTSLTANHTKPHPIVDLIIPTAMQSIVSSVDNPSDLMHSLQVLNFVVSYGWPPSQAPALCNILLPLAKSSSTYMLEAVLSVFEQLIDSLSGVGAAGGKMIAEILKTLFEIAPSKMDTNFAPCWFSMVARCLAGYAECDADDAFKLVCRHLPNLLEYMVDSPNDVAESCKSCVVMILEAAIPRTVVIAGEKHLFEELGDIMFSLLKMEHHSHWHFIREIFCAYLDSAQQNAVFDKALRVLGVLRSDPGQGLDWQQTEAMIGSAIRALGPEYVLQLIPLDLFSKTSNGNAWLLPLLRDNVRTANISHFKDVFLPISNRLQKSIDETKNPRNAKVIETVRDQVWSLLPRYLDLPRDVETAFDKKFVELLVDTLYSEPRYRGYIIDGLCNIVESLQVWSAGETSDPLLNARISRKQAQQSLEFLRENFLTDLLKILLNLFSEELNDDRQALLNTINIYFSVTQTERVEEIFNQISTSMVEAIKRDDAKLTASLLDIVIGLAPYLSQSSSLAFISMFKAIAPRNSHPNVQKKVYIAMNQFMSSEVGSAFVSEHFAAVLSFLLEISETVDPAARRARIHMFAEITKQLSETELVFIPQILPETILAVKDMNEKTRTAAFELLKLMGEKMNQGGIIDQSRLDPEAEGQQVEASLHEFFTALMAGLLSDSPHMISSTITAITYLLYTFRSALSDETSSELLESVNLFLTSKNREIVNSVLGFVKVSITTLPVEKIEPRLSSLIKDLLEWESEHKQHFRLKVRHIIERLLRRFGYQQIAAAFPEGDMKLLQNIQKSKARQKKKSNEAGKPKTLGSKFNDGFEEVLYGSSDEESEDEESGPKPKGDRKPSVKPGARTGTPRQEKRAAMAQQQRGIVDRGEVDLLDENALTFISKGSKATHKKELSHKYAEKDGKVIIQEPGEDDEGDGPTSSIDAYVEAVRNGPIRTQRGRLKFKSQQKRSARDMDDDDEEDQKPQQTKQARRKEIRSKRRHL